MEHINQDIVITEGATPPANGGVVTRFDDSLFKTPSEKAYTVKTVLMVEMDVISAEDRLGSAVKEALSNLSLGDSAQVVGSRVEIIPLDLGEHVN